MADFVEVKSKFLFVIPLGLAQAEGKNKPLSTEAEQLGTDDEGRLLGGVKALPCIGWTEGSSLFVVSKDTSVS